MIKASKQTRREARKASDKAIARTIAKASYLTGRSPFAQVWDGSRLPEDRP